MLAKRSVWGRTVAAWQNSPWPPVRLPAGEESYLGSAAQNVQHHTQDEQHHAQDERNHTLVSAGGTQASFPMGRLPRCCATLTLRELVLSSASPLTARRFSYEWWFQTKWSVKWMEKSVLFIILLFGIYYCFQVSRSWSFPDGTVCYLDHSSSRWPKFLLKLGPVPPSRRQA